MGVGAALILPGDAGHPHRCVTDPSERAKAIAPGPASRAWPSHSAPLTRGWILEHYTPGAISPRLNLPSPRSRSCWAASLVPTSRHREHRAGSGRARSLRRRRGHPGLGHDRGHRLRTAQPSTIILGADLRETAVMATSSPGSAAVPTRCWTCGSSAMRALLRGHVSAAFGFFALFGFIFLITHTSRCPRLRHPVGGRAHAALRGRCWHHVAAVRRLAYASAPRPSSPVDSP